jgi:hypothetical protein
VPVSTTYVAAGALPGWLAGAWSIERDINAGDGSFTGTATFTAQPDGTVRWSEEGQVQLNGYAGPATRVLLVHPASPWEVRFDDGRLFHEFDLATGSCSVEHLCGPDIYRGTFTVVGDDELLVAWEVTGPGRADAITSRYRRVGS